MHIFTSTTIKSSAAGKCGSKAGCKHAVQVDKLSKLIRSQKARIKDQKRENKEKDVEIAGLKWGRIQLKKANTILQKKSEKDDKTIAKLQEDLRIARLPKNSSNSSRPPSTDLYKPVRNKNCNLREKSEKKTGGQPGHQGTTLSFCYDEPDEVIIHSPTVCSACGADLRGLD